MQSLRELGWEQSLNSHLETAGGVALRPGRVLKQTGAQYLVAVEADPAVGDDAFIMAELAGRLRYHESDPAALPAVGDWVGLDTERPKRIVRCLPRRSQFVRRAAGRQTRPQVVAANIDRVLLVTSVNDDFNLARLERYLSGVWESGAEPVVVLNKADLSDRVGAFRSQVNGIAPGVDVIVTSAVGEPGVASLEAALEPRKTVVLVGSSGVGKSSLVNALLGSERQLVREIRAHDAHGKHTTTARELIVLPNGALLIDTPGMRELALWGGDVGVGSAFADVEGLAEQCRFRDCEHGGEPGCAVEAAIGSGQLDARRLASYHKLRREEAYLRRKVDEFATREEARKWKIIAKQYRARTRASPKK